MKAMMRRACTIAGVVSDPAWCKEGIHFTFALEPEAAAISLFEPFSGVSISSGVHAIAHVWICVCLVWLG